LIEYIEEIGSTNADLAARVSAGEALAEGRWLVADRQTAGRGRQGREWADGTGNFMGSTLVRLRSDDPPPASLSFVAALAVYTAIAPLVGTAQMVQLKWPNDVILNAGKVAGILLERVGDVVIVGIGVNLVSAPDLPDRTTACIASTGADISRNAFGEILARTVREQLAAWRAGYPKAGLRPVLARFLACSTHQPGTRLRVHIGQGEMLEGQFTGLDESDGALRLRMEDGSERTIRAGDVIFEGA
jgi:BirA family biotin operon repressor/biotin-[acetyl-CoA-carboxylase] ligase